MAKKNNDKGSTGMVEKTTTGDIIFSVINFNCTICTLDLSFCKAFIRYLHHRSNISGYFITL